MDHTKPNDTRRPHGGQSPGPDSAPVAAPGLPTGFPATFPAPTMPGPIRDVVMAPGGPDAAHTMWWRVGIEITDSDLIVHCGRLEVVPVPSPGAGAVKAVYSHTEAWVKGSKGAYKFTGRYVLPDLKPEQKIALATALRSELNARIGFNLEMGGGFMLGENLD